MNKERSRSSPHTEVIDVDFIRMVYHIHSRLAYATSQGLYINATRGVRLAEYVPHSQARTARVAQGFEAERRLLPRHQCR